MPAPQYSVPRYAMPPMAPLPVDRPASLTWDRWGSRSLAWIGGAITLLGVVLLLVLAIQRGWLGPVPRLLCGLGFAAGLIAVGWRVRRTPSGQIGGFALTATGIAAVYLDVVAATSLYAYLPVAAACSRDWWSRSPGCGWPGGGIRRPWPFSWCWRPLPARRSSRMA